MHPKPIGEQGTKAETYSSPAKGILLTPGTNKPQRKTVSFSASQSLRENLLRSTMATGIELSPQARNSSKAGKSLKCARLGISFQSKRQRCAQRADASAPFIEPHSNRQLAERREEPESNIASNFNGGEYDNTIDLQEPRSRSGQHWKRQFSHYYIKSDHEMRALLKYAQNTKSFASRRDAETIDLKARLKAALAKVATMEARVSDLATQLAQSGNTSMDAEGQADLVTQLAHQTTEVLCYKQKVEELEKATKRKPNDAHGRLRESAIAQGVEPRQLVGSTDLTASPPTSEIQSVLVHAESLEKENAALKKTILRVKEEMKQYEARHKARREEWKRSTDKSKARQADLKQQLRLQEASYQCSLVDLKATHAQEINDLKQQLKEIRGGKLNNSHGMRVSKNEMSTRAEPRAENTEEYEGDRDPRQNLAQQHLPVRTALGTSHGDSSRHKARRERKNDKVSTGESTANEIKAQSSGTEDYAGHNWHHREHMNPSQSRSASHDHLAWNQVIRSSTTTQKLRHPYPGAVSGSPKLTDGSCIVLSSCNNLPPERNTAAQRRIEVRLASKQQTNGGEENMRPTRA